MWSELYTRLALVVAILFALVIPAQVGAEYVSQSNSYRLDEGVIGSNNIFNSASNNYKVIGSPGGAAVGETGSTNYQTQAGGDTSPDPNLSFIVTTSPTNFGNFSPTSSSTATATFSVINYTSYGYVVQIVGSSLKNGSYTIPPMTTSDSVTPGVEQFGINLVANTIPSSVGANPNNGSFGHGEVATGYDMPNKYQYVSGDIIAQAAKSSGQTDYTITYLVNVSALTLGGQYTSNQILIATGTY